MSAEIGRHIYIVPAPTGINDKPAHGMHSIESYKLRLASIRHELHEQRMVSRQLQDELVE